MEIEYPNVYDDIKRKKITRKKNTIWQRIKSFFTVSKKELETWIEKEQGKLRKQFLVSVGVPQASLSTCTSRRVVSEQRPNNTRQQP